MNILVVLALAVVVVSAEAAIQKTQVKEIFKICSASSGATKQDLIVLDSGVEITDPVLFKFVECFFKTGGLLNDAGELRKKVVESVMIFYGDKAAAENFERCKGAVTVDAKVSRQVVAFYRCWKKRTGISVLV